MGSGAGPRRAEPRAGQDRAKQRFCCCYSQGLGESRAALAEQWEGAVSCGRAGSVVSSSAVFCDPSVPNLLSALPRLRGVGTARSPAAGQGSSGLPQRCAAVAWHAAAAPLCPEIGSGLPFLCSFCFTDLTLGNELDPFLQMNEAPKDI